MLVAIVAVFVAVVALAHTAPFPFVFEAFRPGQSVWRMASQPGQAPTLYLTFDDGPNAEWTPPLLDALRDTGSTATFFLIDEHITPETEPIVRRIVAEGHATALHSGSRRPMIMSTTELTTRLREASSRIARISGAEPCRLFRPHAGWRSQSLYRGLGAAGYRLAGWSWGMWDWHWWQKPNADAVAGRLVRKASAGDIIVIHDGHHKNPRADRRHAGETVRLLVPRLREKGFAFGRLCTPGVSGAAAAAPGGLVQP